MKLNTRLSAVLCCAFQAFSFSNALANNNFPTKSITYVAPFPPGGSTDIAARIVSEALSKELRQAVVVENKSGASGSIGVNYIIRSASDGYTVGGLAAPSLTAAFMLPNVTYDLTKDIKPIGQIYITPLVLVVNPKVTPNIKTIKDLIHYAKESPKSLMYTTASVGSTAHLSMEVIRKELKIEMTHVPFKGSTPAMTSLLAGELTFMYSDIGAVLGQIKAGNLYPILVSTETRLEDLPNTPTLKEENIQGAKANSWGGLIAPKDTPDEIIEKYSASLKKVLSLESVQSRLKAAGLIPNYSDSKTLETIIKNDLNVWGDIIRENNLQQR